MVYQLQVQIGDVFPISLVLLTDLKVGRVVFIKTQNFPHIIEVKDGEIVAAFNVDGFSIDGEDYEYNAPYAYKEIPAMLQWLSSQNLQMPTNFVFEG